MQNIPQEQITKRIQLLPESLQAAIFSDRTADVILKNCALRDVSPKQTYFVGVLTRRVLLGYLRPELFASEIQKETGVEELKAQHVAHDLDMEIFSEVRLELKKLYPPTMQTPNVQIQGFARGQAPAPAAPMAKPKYIIPIPERFQNKSFPGIPPAPQTQEAPQTPVASVAPVATPEPVKPASITTQQAPQPAAGNGYTEPAPAVAPRQETKTLEMQKSIAEKKPEQTTVDVSGLSVTILQNPVQAAPVPKLGEKPAQPSIKIAQTIEHTGVKISPVVPLPTFIGARFQQQSSEDEAKGSEQKIKELASKFAVSSTAQPKPQQESAYKEHV